MENKNIGTNFLKDSIEIFHRLKKTADRALEQLTEKDYHYLIDSESNSITILLQHLSGNMISRWTDFLTSDGEKKDRNRDSEFIDENKSVKELKLSWERGWDLLFTTMGSLTYANLTKTIFIRDEPLSVMQAIIRQIQHGSYHIGQIVLIAKHLKSSDWKTLSIPKKK